MIVALPILFSYLFCLFSLPLGVREGLRFVIVTLPGLFAYFLFYFSIVILSIKKKGKIQHKYSAAE